MLKKLNRSNITVRPFSTFKHWNIDTTTNDFLLLKEDGYDITLYDITSSCDTLIDSSSIAIQRQFYNTQEYSVEAISKSGIFYTTDDPFYNSNNNPINWNNSYKRVVYSTVDQMFYRYSNPMYQFGVEHIQIDSTDSSEIRNINDRAVVLNIAQQSFGEEIRPNTVDIYDYSNPDDVYFIKDDGFTNLNLVGTYFSSRAQQIQPTLNFPGQMFFDPTHERFGYVIATWSNYVLVGCPMDENSMDNSKAGSVFLYRIDPDTSEFRFIKKFYSPFTQNGFAEESGWDSANLLMSEIGFFLLTELQYSALDRFGVSISINDNFMAIGAPQASYCGMQSASAGQVFVYDKYKGGFDHWGIINILEGSASYDNFGSSVCISASKLAVGADNAYGSQGAVYIFERFVYGSTTPTSSFWYKLDSETNWCEDIFGELDDMELFSEIPTPYFITGNNTWILQHVITSSEWVSGSATGGVVKLDGDNLLVGTQRFDQSSSVYVFQYNVSASGTGIFDTASFDGPEGNAAYGTGSWVQTFRFTNQGVWSGSLFTSHSIDLIGFNQFYPTAVVSVNNNMDGFGNSIDIKGNNIIIGAPYDRQFFEYSGSLIEHFAGAAYLFNMTQSTWVAQYKLFGEGSDSFDNRFGASVAINNDHIAIGSPSPLYTIQNYFNTSSNMFDVGELYSNSQNALEELNVDGRVFIYKMNLTGSDWNFEKTIKKVKYEKQPKYYFGSSVDLSLNNNLVVGAPVISYTNLTSFDPIFVRYNMPYFDSGSAFYYNLNELDLTYQIGNVFYKDGILTNVTTQSAFINIFQGNIVTGKDTFGFSASYQGRHTIYENEVLCPIAPGEFNVSTNPSAVYQQAILYDINQDGIFDFTDIDLIMKYFQKNYLFVSGSSPVEVRDVFTVESEVESWWKQDMFLLESEDTLLLESWVSSSYDEQQAQELQIQLLNQEYYNRIHDLDIKGYLDVDLNGITDINDATLILRYYIGKVGLDLTDGLTDSNSQRQYSNQIRDYLDRVTGRLNGIRIKDEFLNYRESSSLDKTGSFLAPYVTTVGLYQGELLVAIGKLGRPIKMSSDFPINIAVRWDGI